MTRCSGDELFDTMLEVALLRPTLLFYEGEWKEITRTWMENDGCGYPGDEQFDGLATEVRGWFASCKEQND